MGLADDIAQEYAAENQADSIAAEYQQEKAGPQQGPINKYVRPVVEGVGMIGGGMVGSGALPPFGTAAGGILGYAGSSALMDTIEGLAGERKPPQDVSEALHDTAGGLARGTLYESVGGLAGRTAERLIPLGEKITAPFSRSIDRGLSALAEEIGVRTTPAEKTGSKPLALVESALEKIPGSSGYMQRYREGQLRGLMKERQRLLDENAPAQEIENLGMTIRDAVDAETARLGAHSEAQRKQLGDKLLGDLGSRQNYAQLSLSAKEAFNTATQKQKQLEDAAYDMVRGYAGDTRFAPEPLQRAAKKLLSELPEDARLDVTDIRKQLQALATGSGNMKLDAELAKLGEQAAARAQQVQAITDKYAAFAPSVKQKMIQAELEVAGLHTPLPTKEQIQQQMPPGYTYDQLQAVRGSLNEMEASQNVAFATGQGKLKGTTTSETRRISILRDGLDEAIESGLGDEGKAAWDLGRELVGKRKTATRRSEIQNVIKRDPDRIVDAIIRPGQWTPVNVFKQIYPGAFKPVRQAFTNRLLGVGQREMNTGADLANELDRYGPDTLKAVYGEADAKRFYDLAAQLSRSDKPPINNKFFRELIHTDPALVVSKVVKPFSRPSEKAARDAENIVNLNQVEMLMGRDAIDSFRHKIADRILEENKHGNVSPMQVFNRFKEYGPNTMDRLFGHEQLAGFERFAKVAERLASVDKLAANPSGTTQTAVTIGQGSALINNPVLGMKAAITPAVLARLYLSERGQKLILNGLRAPAGSPDGVRIITQIMALSNDEGIRKQLDKEMSNEPTSVVP
jgi:hypothetical protein